MKNEKSLREILQYKGKIKELSKTFDIGNGLPKNRLRKIRKFYWKIPRSTEHWFEQ
jgi:hypothetical protein